ncbi:hypothetical protein BDV96DRAFT_630656 [Lophiotrema nucula]|uniref:Uncharacterized protein n=1 Tax=Lophiotrema nucula TaxID=690887 RepID=A0A6A5ZDM4_9PLEO|nr:hypothetical protein BDV96DRAFT_630656 [Lophiotrema nucula]
MTRDSPPSEPRQGWRQAFLNVADAFSSVPRRLSKAVKKTIRKGRHANTQQSGRRREFASGGNSAEDFVNRGAYIQVAAIDADNGLMKVYQKVHLDSQEQSLVDQSTGQVLNFWLTVHDLERQTSDTVDEPRMTLDQEQPRSAQRDGSETEQDNRQEGGYEGEDPKEVADDVSEHQYAEQPSQRPRRSVSVRQDLQNPNSTVRRQEQGPSEMPDRSRSRSITSSTSRSAGHSHSMRVGTLTTRRRRGRTRANQSPRRRHHVIERVSRSPSTRSLLRRQHLEEQERADTPLSDESSPNSSHGTPDFPSETRSPPPGLRRLDRNIQQALQSLEGHQSPLGSTTLVGSDPFPRPTPSTGHRLSPATASSSTAINRLPSDSGTSRRLQDQQPQPQQNARTTGLDQASLGTPPRILYPSDDHRPTPADHPSRNVRIGEYPSVTIRPPEELSAPSPQSAPSERPVPPSGPASAAGRHFNMTPFQYQQNSAAQIRGPTRFYAPSSSTLQPSGTLQESNTTRPQSGPNGWIERLPHMGPTTEHQARRNTVPHIGTAIGFPGMRRRHGQADRHNGSDANNDGNDNGAA